MSLSRTNLSTRKAWPPIFLGSVVIMVLSVTGAGAVPEASVTITQPAGTIAKGEELDYATIDWHDPWDMNGGSDVTQFVSPTCDNHPAPYPDAASVDGVWSATYANDDPWLWLMDPGYHGSLHVGRDGNIHPIDADIYTQVTFRMYLGGSFDSAKTPGGKLAWTRDDAAALPAQPNDYGMSDFFRVFPGWNIYTIDLTKIGVQAGGLVWTGKITGLRLYTGLRLSNVPITSVKLDWVRLTPRPSDQAVAWRGSWPGGSVAELLVALDQASSDPLRNYSNRSSVAHIVEPDIIPAGSGGAGSFAIPASFPPAAVQVKVKIGDTISNWSAPWKVSARPSLTFVAPSATSGEDFATTVLGAPWDMQNPGVFSTWAQLVSPPQVVSKGTIAATTVNRSPNCNMPWGDSQLYLNLHGQTVDPYRYRYLTLRVKIDAPFDFGNGWVTRFGWARGDFNNFGMTNDLPLGPGWNVFTIDLWGDILDDEVPGRGDMQWRSPTPLSILRLDPDEMPPAHRFEVGPITLAANNTTNREKPYLITYSLIGSNSARVNFYYSTDPDPRNPRTPAHEATVVSASSSLGSKRVYLPMVVSNASGGTPLPAGVSAFRWDLTTVSPGNYFISADVTDDFGNKTTWVSEAPLIVTP
jgi:hypothetical protein